SEAVECGEGLRLLDREPAERPVQTNTCIRVGASLALRDGFEDDGTCTLQLAEVGESEAQVRAEANACPSIVGRDRLQFREGAFEELGCGARRPARGIRPAERDVH